MITTSTIKGQSLAQAIDRDEACVNKRKEKRAGTNSESPQIVSHQYKSQDRLSGIRLKQHFFE